MGKSIEIIFIEELERRGLQEEADKARAEFLILGREILHAKDILNNAYKSLSGLSDRELLSLLIVTGTNTRQALRYLRLGYEPPITSEILKRANSIARKNGRGSATTIVIGDEDKVVDHTPSGYRKYTTGEYVSNKYRDNFGWKNTYYQHAETTVMVKGI